MAFEETVLLGFPGGEVRRRTILFDPRSDRFRIIINRGRWIDEITNQRVERIGPFENPSSADEYHQTLIDIYVYKDEMYDHQP